MERALREKFGNKVESGTNYSGDTFYSAQGRPSTDFIDENEEVLQRLIDASPDGVCGIEMESFHLFDLADVSVDKRLRAGCSAVVIAKRATKDFITAD